MLMFGRVRARSVVRNEIGASRRAEYLGVALLVYVHRQSSSDDDDDPTTRRPPLCRPSDHAYRSDDDRSTMTWHADVEGWCVMLTGHADGAC